MPLVPAPPSLCTDPGAGVPFGGRRGEDPVPVEEEKSISEQREERKLQEIAGKDLTKVVSLKDKLEFAPRAVLNRNRPEKS
ncbi:PREDICTED: small integral membrane protein 12 [Charadrius vociferus]|uniref:small integral membrane protein 12 n=1 Tax=Charadrius vociferus TaxID=50402 RepID=UPI000521A6DF|nr:PREDICTED: small integral membrane protein 12 [Charadrius vociferus]